MLMTIVFHDATSITGDRKWYDSFNEASNTFKLKVLKASSEFKCYIGLKLVIPYSSIKFIEVL